VAWILFSDALLAQLSQRVATMAYFSLAKGLAFVLATSAFLYLLLTRSARAGAALELAPQPDAPERRAWLRQPVLVFVLLALAVLAGMALALRHEATEDLENAREKIAAIGELKARQLEIWLNEQAIAVDSFRHAVFPRAAATRLLRADDRSQQRALVQWLQENATQIGAAAALVVDARGREVAAAGKPLELEPQTAERIAAAIRQDQPALHVLHRDPQARGRAFIDYVVPWRAEPGGGAVIGALLLRHDAASFLFPLLQTWPTSSASAETMLVRRDGDSVLYLNELRHRSATALTLREPLGDAELAGARFLRGARGLLEGRDYRGAEVLAFGRPIAGSDWLLVSKIDLDEALVPARTEVAVFTALMLGLTLLAALGTLAIWRQQGALTGLRERALRAERDALGEHLSLLSRHANDIVLLLDEAGRIVRANERAQEAYGKRSGAGTSAADLRAPGAAAGFADAYARTLRLGSAIYETTHRRGDGREFPVEISSRRIDTPEGRFVQAIIRDLSERRGAEQALAQSESRFRVMVEQSISGIYVIQDGRFAYVNPRLASIFGYGSPEEIIGRIPDDLVAPRDRARVAANIERRLAGEVRSLDYTFAGLRKDGTEFEVGVHGAAATYNERPAILGALQDISESVRAQNSLRESEERFRAMIEQSISGTCIIGDDGRFQYVNPRLADILGYRDGAQLVGKPVLELVVPEHRELVASNLRERLDGLAQSARYHFDVTRADGARVTLGAHGTIGSYAGKRVVIATVQDVTELLRAEREIQGYLRKLEHAMRGTLEVVSKMVELRDPYTRGHERRVGEICAAIGTEMGLPAERVEGLLVAGGVHDVGKIAVPAEILSKPSRLTPAEYELVKQHAQMGYDVLKEVEFAWPVAEVTRQHHERLDGSGYPQGLKGDAILLEARILAVGDTVEAMSSHRPYRAGLGIDKALAEIERGRGALFDPAAVDACLRLFRDKGYTLPG
jgi:PAS domain S-box-containing protein